MTQLRLCLRLAAALCLLLPSACRSTSDQSSSVQDPDVVLPFRGNVFVTEADGDFYTAAPRIIDTQSGSVLSWNSPSTLLSLYFRVSEKGTFHMDIQARLTEGTTSSTLKFSCNGTSRSVRIDKDGTYSAGDFEVKEPGYVRVDIRGEAAKPSGAQFARISRFLLSGPAVRGSMCYTPEDDVDDAYWYRRGPSVHLFYDFPSADVEWFYNEATVPEGADVPATYYMLTGFSEGYMGIQTHTDGPNTVLFSVWSPYKTDNPGSIPEDQRVRTLRRGDGVTVRDFGGEGSGGQSFMTWPWEPGKTYGTLVHVRPAGDGTTDYTGYFRDHDGVWHLLASFRRPGTDTWYKGAYSFLECFDPNTSIHSREVRFGNAWVRTADGRWEEVTSARFSCDNTGRKGRRGDMYGAQEDGAFLLRNCGFTSETTPYGTPLVRTAGGKAPEIDFDLLENL